MRDRFPTGVNFTILPLTDDVVEKYPDRVSDLLAKEARVRRPLVVTDSAAAVRELHPRVTVPDMKQFPPMFDPPELVGMTSEKAFQCIVDHLQDSALARHLQRQNIPVVGEISSLQGHTFGFDDLDSRAGLVAAVLTRIGADAERIRIKVFGELDGVFSADPRIVDAVKIRTRMSFAEALELSTLDGPRAFSSGGLMGLDQRGIQLQVRSIHDFENKGTRVLDTLDQDQVGIRFISGRKHQALFTVSSARMAHSSGIASLVLDACADLDISVTSTFGGGSTFPFTIDQDHPRREELESRLDQIGEVTVQRDVALVCCIGTGMKQKQGLSSTMTGVLSRAGVNIEEITTSADRNVTFLVHDGKYEDAIVALHREIIDREEVGR